MKNTGLTTNGSFMTVEQTKLANDLAQNVFINLQNAVNDASFGWGYSDHWEKAMQYQTELLRAINELKSKATAKPRSKLYETPGIDKR